MKDFKLQQFEEKLSLLDEENKISLIYQWTVTKNLNLKQFKHLINYVSKIKSI